LIVLKGFESVGRFLFTSPPKGSFGSASPEIRGGVEEVSLPEFRERVSKTNTYAVTAQSCINYSITTGVTSIITQIFCLKSQFPVRK
jgi:hypothetical protein